MSVTNTSRGTTLFAVASPVFVTVMIRVTDSPTEATNGKNDMALLRAAGVFTLAVATLLAEVMVKPETWSVPWAKAVTV